MSASRFEKVGDELYWIGSVPGGPAEMEAVVVCRNGKHFGWWRKQGWTKKVGGYSPGWLTESQLIRAVAMRERDMDKPST